MDDKNRIERWADVVGPYRKVYQISDRGNVRTKDRVIKRGSGKYLQSSRPRKIFWCKGRTQKFMITLVDKKIGKNKTFYVHILVAEAFCRKPDNPKKLPLFVQFIDNNYRNLNFWNLEWTTEQPTKESIIPEKTITSIRRMYQQGYQLNKIAEITGFSISTMAPFIYNTENSQYYNSRYKPKVGKKKRKYVSKRNARINATKVKTIRKQAELGILDLEDTAKKTGLQVETIKDIVDGRSWKRVK